MYLYNDKPKETRPILFDYHKDMKFSVYVNTSNIITVPWYERRLKC